MVTFRDFSRIQQIRKERRICAFKTMTEQLKNLLILLAAIVVVLILVILLFSGKSSFRRLLSIFLEEREDYEGDDGDGGERAMPVKQQTLVEQYLEVQGYPTYRLLNRNGALIDGTYSPNNLPALIETLRKL